MSTPMTITRVAALPATLAPNNIYIVRSTDGKKATLVFTGERAEIVVSTFNESDALTLVDGYMEGHATVLAFATYADMLASAPTVTTYAYVRDASGDPQALHASASYVYDTVSRKWVFAPGSNAAGGSAKWSDIEGRPTSTPAAIDAAVSNAHSHTNKTILDGLGENQGKLTFGGANVSPVTVVSNW